MIRDTRQRCHQLISVDGRTAHDKEVGAILGGAFAPTIAEILMQSTGWSGSVGIYLMVACVISLVAMTLAGETKGRDLNSTDADMEHAQMAPSKT